MNTGNRPTRTLIPAPATERATSRARDAQTAAEEALASSAEAGKRLREARDAKQAAPRIDADALDAAIRAGKQPPHSTAPEREADERAAEAVAKVLGERAREAVAALHRAVHDDRRALIDAQAAAVTEHRATALELVNQAAEAIDALLTEKSALLGYLNSDEYKLGVRGDKRLQKIGSLRFDQPGVCDRELRAAITTASRLLAELQISTTTAGDHADAEAREREEQRNRNAYQQVARGDGIVIGSAGTW